MTAMVVRFERIVRGSLKILGIAQSIYVDFSWNMPKIRGTGTSVPTRSMHTIP
jgi:hypothetical protein